MGDVEQLVESPVALKIRFQCADHCADAEQFMRFSGVCLVVNPRQEENEIQESIGQGYVVSRCLLGGLAFDF